MCSFWTQPLPITTISIHNREKLRALATYLLNYATAPKPEEQPIIFNLNYWFQPLSSLDHSDQIADHSIPPDAPRHTCGFAACAISHLLYAYPATEIVRNWSRITSNSSYIHPSGQIFFSYDAICVYFNLSPLDAYHLFYPESYTKPQRTDPVYVGQRIQAFLDANP